MDRIDERTEIGNFREISSEGLAIDWIYGHIYFSDLETYTIDVMNLDGTMRHTLIDNLVDYPRAIALDPIDGWIFWTDWGRKSHIGRAGLDGSHQQIIVDQDITWPNGITLDFVLKQLYWIDARSHTLSSCNYDGSNRRQILQSTSYLGHPFSISTFEDSVYWTDWDRDTVFGANKFDGKGVRPMTKERLVRTRMYLPERVKCVWKIKMYFASFFSLHTQWQSMSSMRIDNQIILTIALDRTGFVRIYACLHRGSAKMARNIRACVLQKCISPMTITRASKSVSTFLKNQW